MDGNRGSGAWGFGRSSLDFTEWDSTPSPIWVLTEFIVKIFDNRGCIVSTDDWRFPDSVKEKVITESCSVFDFARFLNQKVSARDEQKIT